MILLNLKLNHIFAFDNFEINFSYPNKLRTTLLRKECLSNFPSFRYKKLNLFIGSNATGKTSLVKAIWQMMLFLVRKEQAYIFSITNKQFNDSYIEIDYVDDGKTATLNRIKIKIDNKTNKILMSNSSVKLTNNSSYENRVGDLNNIEDNYKDYLEVLNDTKINCGWNVVLPATETNFSKIHFVETENEKEEADYLNILNAIFTTLDPSIVGVKKSADADNAYVIIHSTTDNIIAQEGRLISDIPYLSSGTKYGFNIANMIFSIKHHSNQVYFIDEQFSYINSDIECAILATMADLLGDDEQLFFTTHNEEILHLGYPFHSFNFMKKEEINGKQIISCHNAAEVENRNNVSPRTIIDNDVFAIAPNINKIYALVEDDNE